MIFLLDTDTCSAHMRRPARLAHRFIQYTGGLAIPTIVLGELYAGAYKHPNPAKLLTLIANLLQEVDVLDFDPPCAHEFGQVRGTLLQQGISVSRMDLMIGSVALVHNLTLVTHNTADFQNIPNLRLVDWLLPEVVQPMLEQRVVDKLDPIKSEILVILADPQRMIQAGARAVDDGAKDRPGGDVDLLDWLRQCRRVGLYEQSRVIYEKGGSNLANLTDEHQIEAEDDFRICARRGVEQEAKPKREQKRARSSFSTRLLQIEGAVIRTSCAPVSALCVLENAAFAVSATLKDWVPAVSKVTGKLCVPPSAAVKVYRATRASAVEWATSRWQI